MFFPQKGKRALKGDEEVDFLPTLPTPGTQPIDGNYFFGTFSFFTLFFITSKSLVG